MLLSNMEGSVEYHGSRYPKPYDQKQHYAVIFSLYGPGVETIYLTG
jgi:hypothetical protein